MIEINKIVVATDLGPGSHQPINFALDLAAKTSAELHLLYAYVRRGVLDPDEIRDRLVGFMPDPPENVHFQYHVDVGTSVAPSILDYAETQKAEVIVLGTRCPTSYGPGLLGDVTRKVLYHAKAAVITVDTIDYLPTEVDYLPASIHSVLVPLDCSGNSERVVATARRLANRYDARLDLLHVITEPRFPSFYPWANTRLSEACPDLEDRALDALRNISAGSGGPAVETTTLVRKGHPAEAILKAAEEQKTGLLLMATHCCTDREHLPISNVTETVARHARAPVCTIKTETPGFLD